MTVLLRENEPATQTVVHLSSIHQAGITPEGDIFVTSRDGTHDTVLEFDSAEVLEDFARSAMAAWANRLLFDATQPS